MQIRSYLLGKVTLEDERQKIEERLMTSDDYFQELLNQEEELILEYVDGQLSESDLRAFEEYFLVSEDRRHKVKVAEALRHYAGEEQIPVKLETTEKKKEKGYVAFFRNFIWAPLPISIAILIAVFSLLVIWNISRNSKREAIIALNKAYQKERPFESRISGLDYAPITNLRGTAAKDKIDSVERDAAELLSNTSLRKERTAENLHDLGRVYLAKKDFDGAIKQLAEAAASAPQNAAILSDLGTAYLEKSKTLPADNGKSLKLSSEALEEFEKAIKLNPDLLDARFNKAICLQTLKSPRQAQEAWQEYLKLDSTSKWAEEARRNLENLDLNKSQGKKKEQTLQEFLTAYEQSDQEKAWQTLSRNRETITGKLIGQQLAGLFLEGNEKEKYLAALKYVGKLENERSGDPYFSEIASFYSSVSSERISGLREAQTGVKKGYDLCLKQRYEEAKAEFQKSKQLFEDAGNIWEAKLADYWIGFCTYQLNQIKESTEIFEDLEAFSLAKNYKWLLSNCYSKLAINNISVEKYSKSIEYDKKSLKLSEETADLYLNQKTLTHLSETHQRLGQHDDALTYIQKGFQQFNFPDVGARQKLRVYASALQSLFAQKLYAGAAVMSKEAIAVNSAEVKDDTFGFFLYAQLSRIYSEQNEFKNGLEAAEQGLKIAENLADPEQRDKAKAAALIDLGHLQRLNKDCNNAVNTYNRALEIYNSMQYSLNNYDAQKGRLFCYVEKGDTQIVENELPKVLSIFNLRRTQILEDQTRNTFFDGEQSVYDLAIDYEFGKKDFERAFNYSEESRARSLLDLQKKGGKVLIEEDNPEIIFDSKITTPLNLSEIQSQMPAETQIVQYSVLRDHLLIWLITKDNFQVFTSDISSKDLGNKVSAFIESIKNKEIEKGNALSRELYEVLFSPIEKNIDGKREICLVPDKSLSHLPFVALISDKTNKFLVADYKIFLAPSSNVFIVSSGQAAKRNSSENEKPLIVGNPVFDNQEFPDLPNLISAEKEAKNIAAFYSESKLLSGREATKENLKKGFSQNDVFHFAGHYVANEKSPLKSGFLVTGTGKDSSLSNYELLNQPSEKTKLIVLSACQTGVERYYQGEGMIGAGRIFLASGIPLIVGSQWQVDSDATAELMQKFHYYRAKEKLSTVVALQRAQQDMLNSQNENLRQPFYWAGFIAIGGHAQY